MTGETPKRERRQLATSELWLHLAVTAERWAGELSGTENGCLPPDQWPTDDPFMQLCRTYDLTPAELAQQARKVAEELEGRAMRAGYERAWIE